MVPHFHLLQDFPPPRSSIIFHAPCGTLRHVVRRVFSVLKFQRHCSEAELRELQGLGWRRRFQAPTRQRTFPSGVRYAVQTLAYCIGTRATAWHITMHDNGISVVKYRQKVTHYALLWNCAANMDIVQPQQDHFARTRSFVLHASLVRHSCNRALGVIILCVRLWMQLLR